jgi:hypothetical protein
MFNIVIFLFCILLFFLLTPDILLPKPIKTNKYVITLVHALLFALILQLTHKLFWNITEGFTTTQPATTLSSSTTTTLQGGGTTTTRQGGGTTTTQQGGMTSSTRPATTRPATTRPATTRPAATRPATTRPAATRPATEQQASSTIPAMPNLNTATECDIKVYISQYGNEHTKSVINSNYTSSQLLQLTNRTPRENVNVRNAITKLRNNRKK